ncbi:hypothetical protein OSH11_03235 [Kaistia dalseonensis]|uniref:DUF1772 domain-containing protein n=1 Tax=Kaistia dalseonensis TaxID=410840 RepID=A0ABU0H1U5_9HYPH|nr:hypothetical protein [Kaistia dalseonensis]MCX5493711.1 hypothetical protein [Kaistia dalseonensis]MDQ0436275.1 hypothetical protein [Kaistia dalseonensis]
MLMSIFHAFAALALAGAICAVVAGTAAEHFRRAEMSQAAETGPRTDIAAHRHEFAMGYGVICVRASAVFAVIAGAAYLVA